MRAGRDLYSCWYAFHLRLQYRSIAYTLLSPPTQPAGQWPISLKGFTIHCKSLVKAHQCLIDLIFTLVTSKKWPLCKSMTLRGKSHVHHQKNSFFFVLSFFFFAVAGWLLSLMHFSFFILFCLQDLNLNSKKIILYEKFKENEQWEEFAK